MEGIKIWLSACGASFGVREVHMYRWPDAETRPEIQYMTITPVCLLPLGVPLRNTPEVAGYDVTTHSVQQVEVTLRIDLYNDNLGLPHLSWCTIAAEKEQAIKNVCDQYSMAFKELDGEIEEHTKFDDERITYHQSMDVVFRVWLDYAHLNRNHKIDTVVLSDPVTLE